MPKRLYGEPGGAQLPQAPPLATSLVIGTGLSIEFWTGVLTSLYFFALRHFTISRAFAGPEGELLGSGGAHQEQPNDKGIYWRA